MNKLYKFIFIVCFLAGILYSLLYELINYGDTAPFDESLCLSLKNILLNRESIISHSLILGCIGLLVSSFINTILYFISKYRKNKFDEWQ